MPRKPFAWSYSRLTSFENCGHRHQQVDLDKIFREEEGPALAFGHKVHKALENACKVGAPLPSELRQYQPAVNAIIKLPGNKFYEQDLAINKHFEPVAYFAKDAWYRCKVDVLVLAKDKALAIDWKTGKVKDDRDQLALNALAIFMHYPKIREIKTLYRWLTSTTTTPPIVYRRETINETIKPILPRVDRYQRAYDNDAFVPFPSGLCHGYCPVKTCEHWRGGRSNR